MSDPLSGVDSSVDPDGGTVGSSGAELRHEKEEHADWSRTSEENRRVNRALHDFCSLFSQFKNLTFWLVWAPLLDRVDSWKKDANMEIEKEVKKMTLGHEFGAGASCLKCKDKCEGFELHFWRKICRNCKCGLTEHNVQMISEENKKVGKLFEDTKYTGLIAKLKTDGVPSYRGNMVTISMPSSGTAYIVPPGASSSSVVRPPATAGSVQPAGGAAGPARGAAGSSGGVRPPAASLTPLKANRVPVTVSLASANTVPRDVPMMSVTYEWAPPAARYIELLPAEKRPVAGTEGAVYRRQQMARQLPEHDQDPAQCHELSPAEVKQMQLFVRKYKDEALGVADVILPEEMALVRAGGGAGGAHGLEGRVWTGRSGGRSWRSGTGAGYGAGVWLWKLVMGQGMQVLELVLVLELEQEVEELVLLVLLVLPVFLVLLVLLVFLVLLVMLVLLVFLVLLVLLVLLVFLVLLVMLVLLVFPGGAPGSAGASGVPGSAGYAGAPVSWF
ncbi:hypothetical protein F7725_023313 [Dissostichus mawsoni]|uniref:PET domain-containing protein n=1 Tax=Dissostichus mawsoni TaxID=36200 RepID=A0A7J5Z4M4_DISMA|nr:hypothetical protein F7725_023313 [Dissostichus mawsoni]